MKLVVREQETRALQTWLHEAVPTIFSSVLLETELRRAASANGASQAAASQVLGRIQLTSAPRSLFAEAGLLAIPGLRSLDALHLATAMREDTAALLAYDRRLISAAESVGIETLSPA